nr:MAG TPA: hypothetical protein [Caudoviricetes sp.]
MFGSIILWVEIKNRNKGLKFAIDKVPFMVYNKRRGG